MEKIASPYEINKNPNPEKFSPVIIRKNLKILLDEKKNNQGNSVSGPPSLEFSGIKTSSESPILKMAKKKKDLNSQNVLMNFKTFDKNEKESLHRKNLSLHQEFSNYNSNIIEPIKILNTNENKIKLENSKQFKNFKLNSPQLPPTHQISKSIFLQQHKYLESLLNDKKNENNDNINNVNNKNINFKEIKEVDSFKEETPLNIKNRETLYPKFNFEKNELDNHLFRHLIFSPNISENLFKKHLLITYKGIIYAKKLLQPTEEFLKKKAIFLDESNFYKFLF